MAAGAKRSKQHAHKVFIWKKINFFLCLGREERKAIEKCIYDKQGWTMWGKPKAGKVNSNKITERRTRADNGQKKETKSGAEAGAGAGAEAIKPKSG